MVSVDSLMRVFVTRLTNLLNLVSQLSTRRVCGVGRSRLGIMVQGKRIRILLTLRRTVSVLARV
jgi:hypothetical protein